jgi:hypothetical protein
MIMHTQSLGVAYKSCASSRAKDGVVAAFLAFTIIIYQVWSAPTLNDLVLRTQSEHRWRER